MEELTRKPTENNSQVILWRNVLVTVATVIISLGGFAVTKNQDVSEALSKLMNPDQTSQTSQPKRGGEVKAEGTNMGSDNMDSFLEHNFPGQDINDLHIERGENDKILKVIKETPDGGVVYNIKTDKNGGVEYNIEEISKQQMDSFSEKD